MPMSVCILTYRLYVDGETTDSTRLSSDKAHPLNCVVSPICEGKKDH